MASVVFQIWARVIFHTKKTYQLSLIAVSAAVLKIGLNVMFIPMLGFWGAALTTLLAYGFMAVAVVVVINASYMQFRVSVAHEACWFACLGAFVAIERFIDLQGSAALALKSAVMLIVVVIAARSVRPFIWQSATEAMKP